MTAIDVGLLANAIPRIEEQRIQRLAATLSSDLARKSAPRIFGGNFSAGASAVEIGRLRKMIRPFMLSDEVAALFEIVNGETQGGGLKPGYQLLSISNALDLRSVIISSSSGDASRELCLRMLPLVKTDNGLLVTLLSTKAVPSSGLFFMDPAEREVVLVASDVGRFIVARIESLQRGVYESGRPHSEDPYEYADAERRVMEFVDPCTYPLLRAPGVTTFDRDDPEQWRRLIC